MALTLSPLPFWQPLDDDGNIIPGGKIFTYAAGSSTKKATYTDVLGQFANENPIILDDAGRVPSGLFLLPSSYKFVLSPADDTDPPTNPIRSQDNIGATPTTNIDNDVAGTAGEAMSAGQFAFCANGTGGLTAGRWYLVDADADYTSFQSTVAGVVATVAAGATGTFRLSGRLTDLSGLTPGAPYFVSATAGGITATAPARVRYVGEADSVSSLLITPNPPISASYIVQGTLANARLNPIVPPTAVQLNDVASPDLNASLGNVFYLISTTNPTIAVPTNPTSGQKIVIEFTASGANRTLSLTGGAGGFRFGTDISALSVTTSGTSDYIGCIYTPAFGQWSVVAYSKGYA